MRSRLILVLLGCLFFGADQAGAQRASSGLSLSVDPASVTEAARDTMVTVTARLNGDPLAGPTQVTVAVGAAGDSATEGTDYETVPDFTLTIPGGSTSASEMFTLTPTNDGLGEGDETLSVSGAATGLTVVNTEITITDDDLVSTGLSLSVSPPSVAENAGATPVTVTAELAFDPRQVATDVDVSLGARPWRGPTTRWCRTLP